MRDGNAMMSGMATLSLDAGSLSHLLGALGPPAFTAARCEVDGDALAVCLEGVRSGVSFLGRQLGPIDAELRLTARRLGVRRIELAWQLGPVGGLSGGLLRAASGAGLVQPLIRRLLDRLGLEGAVELAGDTAIVHLDRLPARNGVMRLVRCERFDVPGAKGQALACSFTLEEDAAASGDDDSEADDADGDTAASTPSRKHPRKRR